MVPCPVCDAAMAHEQEFGVAIDVCATHGLWLDKAELFRVTEAERHDNPTFVWADLFRRHLRPPVDYDRTLNCPHCRNALAVREYQGVHLDWCREHGIWLDNGELEAILNNLRLDQLYVGRVALRLYELKF